MQICILGHDGFVGRAIFGRLEFTRHDVIGINRSTADWPLEPDIMVNCAGAFAKHLANRDPVAAQEEEAAVIHDISVMKPRRLLHVGAIDAIHTQSKPYGQIKRLTEARLLASWPDMCTLRLPTLVGPGLMENVAFDALYGGKLRVTAESEYNVISTQLVAEAVMQMCDLPWWPPQAMNLCASEGITARGIAEILAPGQAIEYGDTQERYQIDPTEFAKLMRLETSAAYVRKYRNQIGAA